MQASPAYPDHPIAGALIAAAAPLEPWIDLTPSFPKHVISGVHLVPIGREGQSALDGDSDDPQRRRFGTRSYGDLSDAVVVTGELVRAGGVVVCEGLAYGLALACRRREAAGALGRRVQAYGGDRRVPHVRGAGDVAMVAGPLPEADPRRFKEMSQIYANIGHPRWEATRRAYTEVTARPQRR